MEKSKKSYSKKTGRMLILSALIATIFGTATYAWFIGMQTVNVSSFDVTIDSTDSLLLSLDGSTWDTTVSISESTLEEVSYEGHTNNWGGDGMLPVSSIGDMDTDVSRMKLYDKTSMTAVPGGYRLLSDRIDNYNESQPEQDGYVVFDLFVKNFSGTQYIQELNLLDEEAIYLTTDSSVVVGAAGVSDTGIENTVRVAFAQIGRVIGTETTPATITGITCTTDWDVTGVTGLCRKAQIWEPNDKNHSANAISFYDTACLARTELGEDVTSPDSYSGSCGAVADSDAYPTYAVKEDIVNTDNVNIYDGAVYNGYTPAEGFKLEAYPYFTDTMKDLTGTSRPSFMTLEPNSITKVRVYIYLEGQDIDNYDFSSIGKQIAVNFGFTKERFIESDIEYDGPELNEGFGPDLAPVITLLGNDPLMVENGALYTDPGATADDDFDGDVTGDIVTGGDEVNTGINGDYVVTYDVQDSSGNNAIQVTRTVTVYTP